MSPAGSCLVSLHTRPDPFRAPSLPLSLAPSLGGLHREPRVGFGVGLLGSVLSSSRRCGWAMLLNLRVCFLISKVGENSTGFCSSAFEDHM